MALAMAPQTIVVVDDEDAICETLRDVFEEEGFAVEVATNGVDALTLLRAMQVKPGMVILDLLMPRMDGGAVYAAMKADPTLVDIPVVISTSDPSRAPSGVLIMRKPVDLDVLLDTVRKTARAEDGREEVEVNLGDGHVDADVAKR
ncbi:MAG: response regulator [Myxococcales bacterium]|nr:response regulator [Myxococcales bacterium]